MDNGTKSLVIDRSKNQVFEVHDDSLLNSVSKINEGPIFGVVGVMNIIGQNYLCVIKEAQVIGKLNGAHIYKVTEAKVYPYFVLTKFSYSFICTDEFDTLSSILHRRHKEIPDSGILFLIRV